MNTMAQNLTITAQWVELFTVTFNSQGECRSCPTSNEELGGKDLMTTRIGYTLNIGTLAIGKKFDFNTPITETITLFGS